MSRLPWPLPALCVWALAWLLFLGGRSFLPVFAAVLLATGGSLLASLWGPTWWRRGMIAAGFPLSYAVLAAGSLPGWGWLLLLGALLLVYPLNAWRDAPIFPTPAGALQGLADRIDLPPGAPVLDAGCGLGAGLRALRQAWPQARVQGVERSWVLRWACALRCPWARVRQGNMWVTDWGRYHLVYLFQRPESMSRAAVKSLAEMPDGAWLVSLNFPLPDEIAATHTAQLADGRSVYAYRCPITTVDHDGVQADEAAGHAAAVTPEGVIVRGERLYAPRRRPGGRRRST
ncbi:MAG: class I SAM-dependent methyltransferase [Comamonas sp.]|nr:class I SAM-dependent methyltransferase [Comamonas sp.]